MTLPAFVFGFCVATLLGAAFHLWKDGGFSHLILDIILAWIGFGVGNILAGKLGWDFINLGPIHLGMAILGCIILIFFGHWLTSINAQNQAQ
jgi:hypothetical protein